MEFSFFTIQTLCSVGFLLQAHLISAIPLSAATNTVKKLYLTEAMRQDNRLVSCDSSELKMTFSNIDYAFAGYDVVKGYPLTMASDPGFRNAIFKADYENIRSNGDCRYIIPKGLNAVPVVSCDVSFKSDVVKSKGEFHKSLAVSANIQGGGYGFEFSASTSYRKATSEISSREYVYIVSKAQCTSYFSRFQFSDPPPFDNGFLESAKVLASAQSTDQDVTNFVETYGTHFLDEITFGSSYTHEHRMSTSTFETLSNEKFGVGVQAGYSGAFSMGGGFSLDSEQRQAASNFAKSVETTTVTVGSAPPSNGDAMTWASAVKENPVPIKYSLRPITDLFTDKFMSGSNFDYNVVRNKLTHAAFISCTHQQSKSHDISCEEIDESQTSDVLTIRGGYPSHHSNIRIQLGVGMTCEPLCKRNDACIGYRTVHLPDVECEMAYESLPIITYSWLPSTGMFHLLPSKMKKRLVLTIRVPSLYDGG